VTLACILGIAGPTVTNEELDLFREVQPWGFILFGRNIETPEQVRSLTDLLRGSVAHPEAPVLIDQEGGRVQRLKQPNWPTYPPARAFGAMRGSLEDRSRWARLNARLIAADLIDVGITVNCAPVADTPVAGAHDVIGDRAYAETPDEVAALARAAAEGFMAGGIIPVIKHIPGHGRALVDSHERLPRVAATEAELAAFDFAPFAALSDMPAAMTAHVVYESIDRKRPATTSRRVLGGYVRGIIGFNGLLISDDLSMKALDGDLGSRARAAQGAGCDVVLHCNGDMVEMRAVTAAVRPLKGASARRAAAALARRPRRVETVDIERARARLSAAIGRGVA